MKTIPNSVWKFLWTYFSKQKVLFFSVIISVFLGEFLIRSSMYYMAEVIEAMSSDNEKKEILHTSFYYIFLASAFLLLKGLMNSLVIFIEAKFMPLFVANVGKDLFSYAHQHSIAFFAEEMAGNVSGKAKTIMDSLYPIYYNLRWGFLTPIIATLITMGFVFEANAVLALVLLFFITIMVITIYFLSKKMSALSEKSSNAESKASGAFVDSISNASLVKNFSNYKFEKKHYFKFMKIAARIDREETQVWGKNLAINNSLQALLQMIFYALPIWYWYIGEISLAEFVLIQSLISVLVDKLSYISHSFAEYNRQYGRIKDGLKLLSKPSDVKDIENAKKLNITDGTIECRNIKYHYKGTKALFSDFNLAINAKEKIGFVGHSGSGKSTLIKLLLRYYDVQSGDISIDGQDISKITQDSLRNQIALIPQDSSLFNRTIMENIRYGNTKATDEEVFEASKKAYIHEFIMSLPLGYESKVGERGVMLSGGERQRIAIARAILKDAQILILDEATSALDSGSEKYIQDSLRELMKDKTVIAVAHRLSTLKEMDRLIVMDKGEIIESGSHKSLLRKKGAYHNFYSMQSSGFIDE